MARTDKNVEKVNVTIANPIIKPIVGITKRFVNNAMTENLLKYRKVKGSVPICALNDTPVNRRRYFVNLFLMFHPKTIRSRNG